jgi:hypothetical protein
MRLCTIALISRVCGYHLVEPDSSLKLIMIETPSGRNFELGIKRIRGNEWMIPIIQSLTRYKKISLIRLQLKYRHEYTAKYRSHIHPTTSPSSTPAPVPRAQ